MSTTLTLALAASLVMGQAESEADELASLLKSKREALSAAVTSLETGLTHRPPPTPGQRPGLDGVVFLKLVYSLNELAQVDVALAKTEAERIAILEQLVKKLKSYDERMQAFRKMGLISLEDASLIRASALDAQIMLLNEKAIDGPASVR